MNTRMDSISATRHILHRTGFAESPRVVSEYSQQAISSLLTRRLESSEPISPLAAPAWTGTAVPLAQDMSMLSQAQRQETRMEANQQRRKQINELRAWWLASLIHTANPLAARMTLFWQNHFTSQQRKVRFSRLMYQQQQTLMKHATGSFGTLLADILRDPAMLIYLDNRSNRRKSPNENLARELLELFVLGEGNYKEGDIKELARALTGLTIDKHKRFVFRVKHHDAGEKTLLGKQGNLGLDDVVNVLLTHPGTATHLTNKLWRYFISPDPDSDIVDQWAQDYRNSNYNTHQLLATMLRSEAFSDPSNHGQLIKSPVEFIVGTHRLLEIPPVDDNSLIRASRSMQQELYEPPNVRGWIGGNRWINSHTLLARRRFISRMLKEDAVELSRITHGLDNDSLYNAVLPVAIESQAEPAPEKQLTQLLRSPAYHLY